MARRVILHCGLHKTGSSALQTFLRLTADTLRDFGVLVPQNGRVQGTDGGHHNVAWELIHDRRYHRKRGGLTALVEEINAFHGDAVLSSEDFETCLGAPDTLAPLLRHPGLRNHEFVVLVYVRDQIAYAERIFVENLRQRMGEECRLVMQEILAHGELLAREWRFQFDFARLLANAAALAPARVVFRSYHSLPNGSIVPDLLGMLFPDMDIPFDPTIGHRANPRDPLHNALQMFHAARLGRGLTEREAAAISLLVAPVRTAPVVLSPRLRQAFAGRFTAGNGLFCRATGLSPGDLDLAAQLGPPPPGACFMDRLFSFETQIAIAALSEMVPREMAATAPDVSQLPRAAQDIVHGVTAAWQVERMAG